MTDGVASHQAKKMGKEGHEHVVRNHLVSRFAEDLEFVLAELVSGSHRRVE